jgi:tetratricopeptide (TPR) repeat protein
MAKIQCISCGGMTDLGNGTEAECPYCGCTVTPRRISSFSQMSHTEVIQFKTVLETSGSIGKENKQLPLALCYLKTGNYELAKKKFFQVIDESPECAEAYFYYTCALLRGKTLCSISMPEARTATEYLKTAMALDEKFIFPKLLYALICVEYYQANDLIPPDNGIKILEEIAEQNINEQEFIFFKQMINTKIV